MSDAAVPASVVTHRRISDGSAEAYRDWQRDIGHAIGGHPGFVDRRVIEPSPPAQTDWIIIERFVDAKSARAWLTSEERSGLLEQFRGTFVGDDDVHLFTEQRQHAAEAASVLISSQVPDGLEDDFLDWQRRVFAAEALFDGFAGHRIERPVQGVSEDWVVILSYDTDEHLNAWLDSAERRQLVAEGERFNTGLKLTRANYGFGFWSQGAKAREEPVFKNNLLVLLMLYPLVFLWSFFVSRPLIDSHGVPAWLSLFIGNLVSTQLLGWFLVPWIFRRFRWWLEPKSRRRVQVAGYLVIAALYVVSMAVFAGLLALPS
jgi:antibiotic biosynthesis monooxygenase (ABM) superfamily enzyme